MPSLLPFLVLLGACPFLAISRKHYSRVAIWAGVIGWLVVVVWAPGLILLSGLVCLCFLPGIVANSRKHHNRVTIWEVTLLTGWTVIGWLIALVWAFTNPSPPPTQQSPMPAAPGSAPPPSAPIQQPPPSPLPPLSQQARMFYGPGGPPPPGAEAAGVRAPSVPVQQQSIPGFAPPGRSGNALVESQAAKEKPTGTKQRSAAEEQFLASFEKLVGRKLTEQEKNLAIAQAEHIGDL